MMQAIRDRAQSWIAWVIVIFLIIVFALWGVQGYVGSTNNTDVAEVNGVSISEREFENQYRAYREQQRQQLLQALGNDVNHPLFKQLFNEEVMRQRVLEGMVQSRLLTHAAIKSGFNVGEEQINKIIVQVPVFQKDGQFDKETYKQRLRLQGMNNAGFKSRLKQDEITAQFTTGLSTSTFVTDAQVSNWLALQNQQRSFSFMTLKAKDYQVEANIDDEMIKSYYDKNLARFMTEEKVTVDYVVLSAEDLSDKAAADEQSLREFYEERKADYAVVDTTEQTATLNKLRERIAAGEAFSTLAKEFSQDSGSSNNGGKIGLISRIDMEQAFSDVAFSLKEGEVSKPVQTSFGMHIVRLDKINGEQRDVSHILLKVDAKKLRTRSFDEVRTEIENEFRTNATERRFSEQFQLLSNISYEQPDTLEPVTNELGLVVKTSESFTRRGGAGIFANPLISSAAFSADVLAGNNSEPIELPGEKVIVLRVNKYEAAEAKPLSEVNDVIIKNLLNEIGRVKASEKAAELLQKAENQGSLSDLAVLENAQYEKTREITRTDKKAPREIVEALFKLPRPTADKPVYKSVDRVSGDVSIIALEKVEDADPAIFSDEERLAARRTLTQQLSERDASALRSDLRLSGEVVITMNKDTDAAQQ